MERYDIYEESFAAMLADAGIDMKTYTEMQAHQIHCCQMVGSMDVAGYSRFDMLNQDTRYKGSADDSRVLYLNHFKVSYQDGIKDGEAYFEIVNVDISGMLLEK